MQGWRTELGANPREVLDLLEFTRARRQSLLRTLLESGSAQVTIRRVPPGNDRDADEPRTVELRAPDRVPAELAVLDGEERLGVVGPRDHTDVMDVFASGLDVTTVLAGETLTLTVTVTEEPGAQGADERPPPS
jgi:hypothetical protein